LTINPMVITHGKDRILMPLVLLGHYTQLLIFPWKLAPDYSGAAIGWQIHFNDPYFYIGIIAVTLWFSLCAIAIFRRNGAMLFCLFGVAFTYGLIGNIVTLIGTNFAERLMYLPSVFFLVLVAMMLSHLSARALGCAMVVILSLASLRTFTYARRWNDRLELYEQAVKDQPGAVRMQMALAKEYFDRGETEKTLRTLEEARRIMPEYARLWSFSAAIAMKMNDLDSASRYLKKAESIQLSMTILDLQQQLVEARAATRPSTQP